MYFLLFSIQFTSVKIKKYSTNRKQGPGGDRLLNLKISKKQDEKIPHAIDINENLNNSGQDCQKQNTPKVCSAYNLRNHLSIQKSVNNVYAEHKKRNPVSIINLKDNFTESNRN